MKHFTHSSYLLVFASLLVAWILAACGGNGGSSATAIPTSTIIPTYKFITQTPVGAIETAVATRGSEATSEATAAANSLDPEVVARGKTRYDALACATCHGENGEGVTDKGKALTSITYQSAEEFISFMRSGGTIGPSHQYASNRLSTTGGTAVYQYLLSLRKSS